MIVRGSLRLYGALDLAFAALYVAVNFAVVRGRSTAVDVGVAIASALLAASGCALLVGARIARPLGIAAAGMLLALCLALVTALVAGAAYLRGIYGPLGQGMAWVSLIVAALIVELFGLLPIFQLRMLLRDDVKRHLHGEP